MSREQPPGKDRLKRRTFLTTTAAGAACILGTQIPVEATAMKRDSARENADLREKLLECLGGPWPEECDLRPKLRETIQKDGYRIESQTYEAEPDDPIPA